MNQTQEVVFRVKRLSLSAALVASGVLFLPGNAKAQEVYTMSNGGSTATVNVGNTGVLGMNSWSVLGGQNQLNQQWFWYSVNGVAQQPINAIGTASVFNFSNPASPIDNLGVVYQNAQLSVQIQYVLSGAGASSGNADMMEYISIVNNEAAPINLSFYQYSNFNLFQNSQNSVSISGSPGAYTGALQTAGGPGGNGIAEVIEAPLANDAEAGTVPTTFNELNSGSYYTLNNNTSAGPGDVTWAFQWNATLQANGSVDQYGNPTDTLDITKDKGLSIQLVPEPSTLAFIALGISALGLSLRRKSA
jgi:hypothetical protein